MFDVRSSQIGPFDIDKDMAVEPRELSWNKEYALLFLDNPLGAHSIEGPDQ